MKQIKWVLVFAFAILINGCSTVENDLDNSVKPIDEESYSSDFPYQLNVIYFVPRDLRELPQYQQRLSTILLSAKAFVKKNMAEKGYGNNEMGLSVNKNSLVKIHLINAKSNRTSYSGDKDKTPDLIKAEVDAYFKANKITEASKHFLVIMPSEYGADKEPIGGGPFFGLGTWCFALDYPDMDQKYLGTSGRLGELATKWIGGLVHELGHGLNIGHDKSMVSDQAKLGESLMAAGNYTYGNQPTHLTIASCAILNTSQILQKTAVADLYAQPDLTYTKLSGTFANGTITFTGSFETNKTTSEIILFLDPAGEDDYNQIGWVVRPNGSNFEFKIPISELEVKSGKYDLNLTMVYKNGYIDESITIPFQFVNGVPNLSYKK